MIKQLPIVDEHSCVQRFIVTTNNNNNNVQFINYAWQRYRLIHKLPEIYQED